MKSDLINSWPKGNGEALGTGDLGTRVGPNRRSRLERAVARRIREAKFRSSATLESFDWTFNAETISREPFEELAAGDWCGENRTWS